MRALYFKTKGVCYNLSKNCYNSSSFSRLTLKPFITSFLLHINEFI